MTRLIVETDDSWTKRKIESSIRTEADILKRAIQKIQNKLKGYETTYGKFNREFLYGKVDDMELLEWEGEMETLERLTKKVKSLDEINFEYK